MNGHSSHVGNGEAGTHVLALLSPRPAQVGGLPAWPAGVRCDLVEAPVEVCCGVVAHLARAELPASPIACVGDRFMFLVSAGSTALCLDGANDPPDGLVLHEAVEGFPANRDGAGSAGDCWVLPPDGGTKDLPPARAVLAALCSAYEEYRTREEIV